MAIAVTGTVEDAGAGYVPFKIRFLCSYAAEIQMQSGGMRRTGNLVQEVAVAIKHLYAAVARIGDVNLIFAIHRNAVGSIGIRIFIKAALLMGYRLFTTKGECPLVRSVRAWRYGLRHKLLNIASLPVRDIDIALTVGGHVGGL